MRDLIGAALWWVGATALVLGAGYVITGAWWSSIVLVSVVGWVFCVVVFSRSA